MQLSDHVCVMAARALLTYCCDLCYDPSYSDLAMILSWQPEYYSRFVVTPCYDPLCSDLAMFFVMAARSLLTYCSDPCYDPLCSDRVMSLSW